MKFHNCLCAIYGRCNWTETSPIKQPGNMALKKLQKQYKFYLAFENSNCYGYVTEKFFKTIGKGLVPIVMGGSKNYKKIAPPNSYIDIDDYKSPQDLAKYLKYLDKNDKEYLKYFEWIHDYSYYKINSKWCQLCRKLNNASEPEKSYSNITKWWLHNNKGQSACHP